MEGAEVERPTWSRASSRREFLRTYKACMSCRQRKAKCELGGNNDRGIPPGPPCLRCRREQRNCQFSEDRAWARKKKKGNYYTRCCLLPLLPAFLPAFRRSAQVFVFALFCFFFLFSAGGRINGGSWADRRDS